MVKKWGMIFLGLYFCLYSDEYDRYHDKKSQIRQLSLVAQHHNLPLFDDGLGSFVKHQKSLSEKIIDIVDVGINFTDQHAHEASSYVHMIASIIKRGCKMVTKDARLYNLQRDVFDIFYKKALYDWICLVDGLLLDLTVGTDLVTKTQACLLLCKIPVHQWYQKSFYKGLHRLYELFFDVHGQLIYDQKNELNIGKLFAEYYKKVPRSWVDIAAISDFWCYEQASLLVKNEYDGKTADIGCDLAMNIMAVKNFSDLFQYKNEVKKYHATIIPELYQVMFFRCVNQQKNEYGVCCLIEKDPIWKNMSYAEKYQLIDNHELHEILIMRAIVFSYIHSYFTDMFSFQVQSDMYDEALQHALYELLPSDVTIFYYLDDSQGIKNLFFNVMTYFDKKRTEVFIFNVKKK